MRLLFLLQFSQPLDKLASKVKIDFEFKLFPFRHEFADVTDQLKPFFHHA